MEKLEVEEVKQVERQLVRDFEGTCVAIAGEVTSSDDPTRWLQLLIVLVQNGSGDVGLRLETDFLPQIVQLVLGKSFDLSAVEGVNEFLQWTLATVAKRFQLGDTCRISCLARVLDAHRRFYLYHGTNNDGQGGKKENGEASRFTERESSEYISRYFLRNLEFWGQTGGFALFLKILCANATFEMLQCVLRIIYDVKDHLCAEFLAEYFPKLVDAVCTQIRSLQTAEFHLLSRDALLEVVQVMELLLVKIQHDVAIIDAIKRNSRHVKNSVDESGFDILLAREVGEQRVQLLRLDISLRFFQSSSLEKRIYGLTEIVVVITRLYNDQIQEQAEPTAISLYATLRFLVDWMHDKQLMQELLGEKMHVELIKRSTSLFQFASELECLPTEWVDLVWNCYHSDTESASESQPVQRRHEAFRSTIHDLLLEMVTFMELPSLKHLVKRIEAVGPKLDSNQLGLFAAIAARRLVPEVQKTDTDRQRSLRQRILMHLWTVVLPSNTVQGFCDEVLLRMREMLRLEAVGEESGENDEANVKNCTRRCEMVDELLCSCLDKISRRENLAISLKLFTQLSALIAEMGIVLAAPHQLNKSYVKFLLDEIVIYKQEVRQNLQTTQWNCMDDDERAKLSVFKDHVNEIKNRLLALRASWILDEYGDTGDLFLCEDQLDNVWKLMVADAFLLDEAALCFQWIELCMNTPLQKKSSRPNEDAPQTLMPLNMVEFLVTTKFPTLSGDCITLSTLCCFHSIFRRINLVKGGLESFSSTSAVDSDLAPPRPTSGSSSDGNKDESVELMTGQPLVGLDQLWQLAVSATDSAVAEEIITLLANFHLAFAPSVRQTELPFQCKLRFVEKCMEFIASAKAEAEMIRTRTLSPESDVTDKGFSSKLAANVAVVNRCVDLLRYFLEACKIGYEDSNENERETLIEKLESKGFPVATVSDDSSEASKVLGIEHLEERLPYLEIYPSPIKEMQSDGGKHGYCAARRPSWTFRQQHALLDVIVDGNEEVDTEDTEGESSLLRRSLDSPASRRSEAVCSPLRVELRTGLLNKSGSPFKSSMHSPGLRANLRWPQAPSPQRGPDLRPEDVDQALTDYTEGHRELNTKDERQTCLQLEDVKYESKSKARYSVMSQILANKGSHFDVLLGLVDWDETTSQRTWDLLCRLPTNNELLRKMIRLRRADKDQDTGVGGDVDWSDLLDGSSIQRLLYALRLVEALLIPIDKTGNDNGDLDLGRRQWRERFVRLGGARHLYETLLKWPEKNLPDPQGESDSILSQYAQNLRATCLAAVMRVLNYFFHWNLLNSSDETQQEKLSPFDVRLQMSTLPEFVRSIGLSSMLQAAVQLTERFCSQECHNKASFSEESAETVYCGVQMCCSLIRFSPHLIPIVFEPDQDTASGDNSCSRITLCGWLKALLVDCSSKPTRAQVLGVLSDLATAFGAMDYNSRARKLFDPLIVSACELSAQDLSGSYSDTALEELFAFCKILLRSCGQSTNSEDGSDTNAVAAELMRKNIPSRIVINVYRIVFQQKAPKATRRIQTTRNKDVGILCGYLELLALLARVSDKLRTAILRNGLPSSSNSSASNNGSEEMINFIHDKLLFGDKPNDHDTPTPPICRTSLTRELAQTLLLTLVFPQTSELTSLRKPAIDCDPVGLNCDLSALLNRLRGYQVRVLEAVNLAGRQWNFAPADSLLDTTKSNHHAGLVNPGCICYMNALVQQLFRIPDFCEGLLELDSSQISPDRTSSTWKDEVEQLQKLFVSLAYTNYRSCDPTAFAVSHKDMDGNSTDVHLQMDADEFFSLLLDRLETFIRPKTAVESSFTDNTDKDFMARCFGGVLVNQILTQQGNLSEREEKFFALSLEVSKKRHMTESLELYVQGESLEGENAYFCEREQRKVSATKRVCIKTLPRTLVCHLKRFEFDYDTMEKMKINDFLEFPMELDMFPYTSEALTATDNIASNGSSDKEIMYDLVGVVVHSGTSDTGHYYSFIKDRHEVENQRWLEFNDEIVREFDVDTMGEECFGGGEEVAQKWDSTQRGYAPVVQMKRRSAYMLIYERRSAHESSVSASSAAEKHSLPSHVQALATQIMQENVRYEGIVNAFDPNYEQFIRNLVEGVTRLPAECDPALARQANQLGCEFRFGIRPLRCRIPESSPSALKTKDNMQISLWLSVSDKKATDQQVLFSKWILADAVASPTTTLAQYPSTALESQRTWLFDVLFLSSESPDLAESCFQVLFAAVNILAQEAAAGHEDTEQSLTDFFRQVSNLFFSRESHLELCDPVSGCVLTLSTDVRVAAMKQLGIFLQKCVGQSQTDTNANRDEKVTTEMCRIHRLFLENLQFLNRFLNTLQIPLDVSDIIACTANSSVSSRGIAPLAIETRTATHTRQRDLRVCMFQLDRKLLKHLLWVYDEPAPLTVDSTLLMNHTALKNVVLLSLEDIVVPVLTRIIFESETPSSKCDRLVALLIGVLEEVKDTHAQKVLAVFGGLLDAEEVQMKSLEEAGDLSSLSWTVHRHVFSPSRGVLESVVYYRDHRGSHDYTLLLLGFMVHRASRSPILQELFMNESQFCSHVKWIPGWLVDHLDPNGAVRTHLRVTGSKSHGLSKRRELEVVKELFAEVEKAFGVNIPAYCPNAEEGQQLLISRPSSPSPIAAEDVILEALLEKVNQHDPQVGAGKRTTDELGPEHEGVEVGKVNRSRDELSMLLHIDLDITHNSAREA